MAGNTLTRSDLSEAVYREIGLSRNESAEMVETDPWLAVGAGAQVDVDATAAGAHVAGGPAHLVRDMGAQVECRFRSVCHPALPSAAC